MEALTRVRRSLGEIRIGARLWAVRREWLTSPRALARAEAALWSLSLLCAVTIAWYFADARVFQRRAAIELREQLESTSGAPRRRVAIGAPIGELSIPRLELTAVVAEGAGDEVLRRAIGHLPTSSRPGEFGNVALAGHRDTFFRPLERISTGDFIHLRTPDGRFDYQVEWTAVVDPDRVDLATAAGPPALTLITCYPFRWVGDAPRRFVVRARMLRARPALTPPV